MVNIIKFHHHFFDANTGCVVGDDDGMGSGGMILKTTNGGTTWTPQVSNTYSSLNSVHFTDANTGYITGGSGLILKTTNGGTLWSALTTNATGNLKAICFPSATTAYVVGSGGTILKTTNSGTTWTAQTSGRTNLLKSVYFVNATTGYAVGDSATLLKTVNGGTTWTILNSGVTGFYNNLNAVYFTDVNTGYIAGQSGKIIKTTNGGTTWTTQTTGFSSDIYSIHFVDANNGYAAGYIKVLKTIDGGTTWTIQSTGISGTYDNLSSIFFLNSSLGYTVGYKGRILKTINGGVAGVEENTKESQLNIYPNPTADYITVNIDNKDNSPMTMNIYNTIGKLVKQVAITQNQQKVNVQDLNNGIYIVEISSKGLLERQKLIIQK